MCLTNVDLAHGAVRLKRHAVSSLMRFFYEAAWLSDHGSDWVANTQDEAGTKDKESLAGMPAPPCWRPKAPPGSLSGTSRQ